MERQERIKLIRRWRDLNKVLHGMSASDVFEVEKAREAVHEILAEQQEIREALLHDGRSPITSRLES